VNINRIAPACLDGGIYMDASNAVSAELNYALPVTAVVYLAVSCWWQQMI
jgi:hypothetical protein